MEDATSHSSYVGCEYHLNECRDQHRAPKVSWFCSSQHATEDLHAGAG